MAPHPDTDLDQERKNELIMEKRLRACRVNIIPRNKGYFSDSDTYTPPQVNKRPQSPAPYPSAVKNVKNPNALRYWNQCMDKASVRQNNAESLNYAQKSNLTQKALDSSPIEFTSDSENSKFASKSKAQYGNLQVIVPDITYRVRSESVPRTIRTLKVTATVTPSPALNRKAVKSDVDSLGKELMSPILFQSKLSEATIARVTPNPVLNGNINKPEVEGANLFTSPENGITNDGTKYTVFSKNNMKQDDGQVNFRRNFLQPITLSEASTSCKANCPSLNVKVHTAEVKGMASSRNGSKEENESNTLFTSTNVKEYYRPENSRRNFQSPIPFHSPHSEVCTPYATLVPALNEDISKLEVKGSKHSTSFENGIKIESVKNTSFVESDGKEYSPGILRKDFTAPIPFHYELNTNGVVNKHVVKGAKLSTSSENGTDTSFIEKNGKEYRPVSFMSPTPYQSPISKTNIQSMNPVPALIKNENKVVEGEKQLSSSEKSIQKENVTKTSFPKNNVKDFYGPETLRRDFMSPIPFQSRTSEAITPSLTPVPALKETNYFIENDVKEYRPENLRIGFVSPITFHRNSSKENPTRQTSSPALKRKVNKSENEGIQILTSSENGIIKQGTGLSGNNISVSLRNLNSPIPLPGHKTETNTLIQKVKIQKVDGVIDALPSIEDILEKISPAKKNELGLNLFNHLPENVVEGVVLQKLSTMPSKQLGSMLTRLPEESVNKLIPNLFMKASDDVKLSLILDCLPKLSVQKILKDLSDSEKETRKESLRKMTKSLMTHRQK